jgi:hypothetical protein
LITTLLAQAGIGLVFHAFNICVAGISAVHHILQYQSVITVPVGAVAVIVQSAHCLYILVIQLSVSV